MFEISPFDHQTIYAKHVRGRKLVYLDHNIWIKLCDGQSGVTAPALDAANKAVRSGNVLFPLSFPLIKESLRRRDESDLLAQARLMGKLSENVTFRSYLDIRRVEAAAAYPVSLSDQARDPDFTLLFTYIPEAFCQGMIEFPEDCNEEQARIYISDFQQMIQNESFLESLAKNALVDTRIRTIHQTEQDYPAKLGLLITENAQLFRKPDGRTLDRERMLVEEHVASFKEVLPLLADASLNRYSVETIADKAMPGAQLTVKEAKRKIAEVIKAMPSVEISCQLHAAKGMNPSRRVERQDFWDHWHATYVPYVDFFITGDGGLFDLLTRRCNFPRCRAGQVLYIPKDDARLELLINVLQQ